jgi:hypothetical protein
VEIYTSARDKFACHPHLVFNRLSLQFKNHQAVVGLVMDIEALSPGNAKFIGSFSFHGLLLSSGINNCIHSAFRSLETCLDALGKMVWKDTLCR